MSSSSFLAQARQHLAVATSLFALLVNLGAPVPVAAQEPAKQLAQHTPTASPIKHVIVIIGENRTFDHIFATYKPKTAGETVNNLLSEGIIKSDGTPGPNYSLSLQNSASDTGTYSNSPGGKSLYGSIPPVVTGGPETAYGEQLLDAGLITTPYQIEPGYLSPNYYQFLMTGGTGLTDGGTGPDTRIPNDLDLPGGAFQLTPGVPYDAYASSPVHRFYQMWQQEDCNASLATSSNPSGCLHDLFPWVEVTIGAGDNGLPQPSPFTTYTTGEGSTSMEFYNMQQGDAPYLKHLADSFTISDNYHQAAMGGTGLNHIMLGFADAIWYSDGNGNALVPTSQQIENPNAQPGTNNWYVEDGYNADGTLAVDDNNPYASFTIPPTSVRHIGDALLDANVSFKYYGDGWNLYLSDPNFLNPLDAYCNICNPFQYASDIMTNGTLREEHIQDLANFYEDVKADELPSVSIIKPSGFVDGHPASSKIDLFEGFVKQIVDKVQASGEWASTAIFVTFDEGGGYFDSGYVQPLDFFGDGTRIPLLIVSPFTTGGHVNHRYSDHVSLTKFIERNWGLAPLTSRSRDNFPNPKATKSNPYVPTNSPALDDLFDAFNFKGSK